LDLELSQTSPRRHIAIPFSENWWVRFWSSSLCRRASIWIGVVIFGADAVRNFYGDEQNIEGF
jgi:hypothetical protein